MPTLTPNRRPFSCDKLAMLVQFFMHTPRRHHHGLPYTFEAHLTFKKHIAAFEQLIHNQIARTPTLTPFSFNYLLVPYSHALFSPQTNHHSLLYTCEAHLTFKKAPRCCWTLRTTPSLSIAHDRLPPMAAISHLLARPFHSLLLHHHLYLLFHYESMWTTAFWKYLSTVLWCFRAGCILFALTR